MRSPVTPRVRAGALLARRDWDAIVIGSGVGGLVSAALLARRCGMRVLVLERHYEPGGLTQTFRRRRFAWDVGVHYLGELGPGSMLRRLFEVVGGGRLAWARLPALHDRLVAPGLDARFGGDRAALRAQWLALAPGEERAVDGILDAVEACARAVPRRLLSRMRAGADGASRDPFFALADRTTDEALSALGASPRLRALVTYTWSDYGSPPERSSFAALAVTTAHYLGGGFYPVGGGAEIAHALTATLAEHRGAVVVRAGVEEVLLDGGRVHGARLEDGTTVRAPIVISDAGARATLERLVREPTELRERVRAIGSTEAHVGLYLGLRGGPRELGLDGANLWLRRDPIDAAPRRDAGAWAAGEVDTPPEMFVSTACANDPSFEARFPGRSAISCAVAVPFAPFSRWAGTRRARRGAEYEAHKARLGRGMLRLLAPHLPLDALAHVEVSTPLSTASFTGHARGEVGGLDPSPLRFRRGPGPRTDLEGLFLTGQDIWMCGVGGAASGGLASACAVSGRDLVRELIVRA